jgi:hypothetical protein
VHGKEGAMAVLFPRVSGLNLEREQIFLPQDLGGQVNILFIAFRQWHQREINTWVPAVRQLEAAYEHVLYYELPIIRSQSRSAQAFINSGMRAGSADSLARERTIPLYLDKEPFCQALDMPDEDRIYVLLVDGKGQVLWRERGVHTPDKEAALNEQLEQVMRGMAVQETRL